jgi:uncharacterized protein (TIGR03000 family)
MAVPDTTVTFDLRVPANAEVWFNDSKTDQTGVFGQFVSPRLAPESRSVCMTFAAAGSKNRRQMEQTRHLTVHAGERLAINFMK